MSEDMCQLSPCGLLCPAPEATVVSNTQSNLNSCIELGLPYLQLWLSSEGPKVLQACSKRERESFKDNDFTSDGTEDCHKMVAHLKKDKGWF